MAKSEFAAAVDEIQRLLKPYFKDEGFRVRGRTWNRKTVDGLIQVVNLQTGRPNVQTVPGILESLHGLFTVNLGLFVPEVEQYFGLGKVKPFVQEYDCCIRVRLGEAAGEVDDIWWHAVADHDVFADVTKCLKKYGIPLLDGFATRDGILDAGKGPDALPGFSGVPPRIVRAIILAVRGEHDEPRELITKEIQAVLKYDHKEPFAKKLSMLAADLGLGEL